MVFRPILFNDFAVDARHIAEMLAYLEHVAGLIEISHKASRAIISVFTVYALRDIPPAESAKIENLRRFRPYLFKRLPVTITERIVLKTGARIVVSIGIEAN